MGHLASTDGVTLAVHDLGGDGEPALLAHATGFHGQVWAPFARGLTGLAAVAPDLRGHGDSTVPSGVGFDWNGFADDVLACVDGLGLHRPAGIGHSKGGAALLLAEARRPGTFRGLWLYEPVVVDPALIRGEGENPLAAGARARRDRFASREEAEARYRSKPPMDVFDAEALHCYVAHGFADQADGSVVLKCRPAVEAEVYQMGARNRAFESLPEVKCPTIVARGAVDEPGPAAMAQAVAERLPSGRLAAYDDLGHFGPMQAPARLAADASRFFAGG